jgi:hypothetical protein
MESYIKTSKTFDVANVTFGAMKILETGGRMIYMNYGGNPIYIQTPEMLAPFGLSSWSNDGGSSGDIKYSIEMAFKNRETSKAEARFFKALEDFDKKVLSTVLENSALWLKKKYNSLEVIEALYTPCIKFPKDKVTGEVTDKYPPTFRVNVPFRDNTFACDTYDTDGNKLDLSALDREGSTKGCMLTNIIQCSGIWIAGGKFGCTWRAVQMRMKRSDSLPPCAFMDEFDADDDGFDKPTIVKNESVAVKDEVIAAKEEDISVKEDVTAGSEVIKDDDEDGATTTTTTTTVVAPTSTNGDDIHESDDAKTPTKKKTVAKKK